MMNKDPCDTDADGCEAITQDGEACLKDARYGVLCDRHARQLAYAPMGSGRRRVVRVHLDALSEAQVVEAEAAFLNAHGYTSTASSNPFTYAPHIVAFLEQRGEASATEITAHVQSLTPYDITAGKTGQVLRLLASRGVVERRAGRVAGKGANFYRLAQEN